MAAQEVHIFSDSLYAQQILLQRNTRTSSATSVDALMWTCLQMFLLLRLGLRIVFHWIPSHCGIEYNEQADRLAKETLCTFANEPPDEWKPLVRIPFGTWQARVKHAISIEWQRMWSDSRKWTDYPTGQHLYELKPTLAMLPELWSGPRYLANLRCRLRHGKCGLNYHLNMISVHDDSLCEYCQEEDETVHHYMLRCPFFAMQRIDMLNCLSYDFSNADENAALAALLGTLPDMSKQLRKDCVTAVNAFLIETNRFAGKTNDVYRVDK
jgi:hypothetical protein